MIDIEALVSAVQSSAIAASDALVAKNLEILQQFFEPVDEGGPTLRDVAERALAASRAARDASDIDEAKAALDRVAEVLEAAAARPDRSGTMSALRPKTTAIQYPQITSQGPVVHTVHVPLLAIAPIAFPRVSELRFKTELELDVSGDKLEVGPPPPRAASSGPSSVEDQTSGSAARRMAATLEIVISDTSLSQGMRLIVEGYERALRAQIPG